MRHGAAVLNALDKGLVALIAVAYLATAAALVISCDARAIRFLLVPAVSFALVSVVRAHINAPRPYEGPDAIEPLVAKDTHGKSMPSRHVFSAAIIACAFATVHPTAGAAAIALSIVVAYVRVAGGMHFPRDVVAALVSAFACALVGFALIP